MTPACGMPRSSQPAGQSLWNIKAMLIWFVVLYLLVTVGIGVYASTRVHNSKDFAAGGRSMRACEFLRAQGVDAVNIAGGTRAWISAGHAVATGAELG